MDEEQRMILIRAENLAVGYESRIVAEGINFTVNEGDYLCIVGENGAGKTTLLKTLLRLIQPVSGSLEFSERLDAGGIGYLPQQTDIQRDFPASVREIVLSGCQGRKGLRPFYGKSDKARADENIARLGIDGLRKRCYRELSGGQQQRVLLARALCAADDIILLDEPASGLDPSATADMYSIISELNREGVTVIMISHDIDAAVSKSSHILMLGDEIFSGRTEEFAASEFRRSLIGKGGAQHA